MKEIIHLLLYSDLGSELNNLTLFAFRILFAFELFYVHGMKKIRLKNGKQERVPNPLHLPEKINAFVAVFSDTVVPIFIAAGLGTRLFVLPTLGVTSIGYFVVHRNDSLDVEDVPYMYSICLLLLLFIGAGTYSFDNYLIQYFNN
ncbi:MAG: DoxX family protein [Sporocytophaga sp.]|uniref:DoxX family protein n=1 Tax=Sporocytophaga sp. TaxID=2231183 RepID=UPI001B0D8E3C|nr:DoxX family protein [Sporocytophaga sp.]MBO9701876.1 DoxX family protein [Sporocytophaga sp.]